MTDLCATSKIYCKNFEDAAKQFEMVKSNFSTPTLFWPHILSFYFPKCITSLIVGYILEINPLMYFTFTFPAKKLNYTTKSLQWNHRLYTYFGILEDFIDYFRMPFSETLRHYKIKWTSKNKHIIHNEYECCIEPYEPCAISIFMNNNELTGFLYGDTYKECVVLKIRNATYKQGNINLFDNVIIFNNIYKIRS